MSGVYVSFGWWDAPIFAALAVMVAVAAWAVWREVRS